MIKRDPVYGKDGTFLYYIARLEGHDLEESPSDAEDSLLRQALEKTGEIEASLLSFGDPGSMSRKVRELRSILEEMGE